MSKYLVSGYTVFNYHWEVEVEADCESDAEDEAKQLATEGEVNYTFQDPDSDWVNSVEEV